MGSREPRSPNSILAALALATVLASSGRGQQATDVTLSVSFANGQTVFHVGRKPISYCPDVGLWHFAQGLGQL
jgi:hypothetical protein